MINDFDFGYLNSLEPWRLISYGKVLKVLFNRIYKAFGGYA